MDSTYEDHWQSVESNYRHLVRVYDLGGGQKEVLVTRAERFHESSPFSGLAWAGKSDQEREADNADRAARRAKSEVRRRCKAMGLDSMLTLTYRANQTDEALCKAHMKEFIRRLRRLIPDFLYVAAFERQDRGAWHVHMAVRRVQSHFMDAGVRVKSFDLLRSIWRSVVGDLGGNIDLQRKRANSRKTVAQLAAYLSKYMVKAFAEGEEHAKRWTASRFKLPDAALFSVFHRNLKDIIADLVARYAPSGTQIRCCLVDQGRGFFMTVEPSTLSHL
jgi:hypothetical protein